MPLGVPDAVIATVAAGALASQAWQVREMIKLREDMARVQTRVEERTGRDADADDSGRRPAFRRLRNRRKRTDD